jgi:hypothetical protein
MNRSTLRAITAWLSLIFCGAVWSALIGMAMHAFHGGAA